MPQPAKAELVEDEPVEDELVESEAVQDEHVENEAVENEAVENESVEDESDDDEYVEEDLKKIMDQCELEEGWTTVPVKKNVKNVEMDTVMSADDILVPAGNFRN